MFTRNELIERMYPELIGYKSIFERVIQGFSEIDDNDFIRIYQNKTGHKLIRLRKNLYA